MIKPNKEYFLKNPTISFSPLTELDFPLLLKWLMTPHVRDWWDSDINWNIELIKEKFGHYVRGYKIINKNEQEQIIYNLIVSKPIAAYIININNIPIGYIQTYYIYDFSRSAPLVDLPNNMAGFDMYIGEKDYIGKNLGYLSLKIFLEKYIDQKYEYCFADPDLKNIAAIKTYKKVGFREIKENIQTGELWMTRKNSPPLL